MIMCKIVKESIKIFFLFFFFYNDFYKVGYFLIKLYLVIQLAILIW